MGGVDQHDGVIHPSSLWAVSPWIMVSAAGGSPRICGWTVRLRSGWCEILLRGPAAPGCVLNILCHRWAMRNGGTVILMVPWVRSGGTDIDETK